MESTDTLLREEGLNDSKFICFSLILLTVKELKLTRGKGNVWEDRIIKLYKLKSELNYSQTWRQLRELTFQSYPKVIWSHIPSLGKCVRLYFQFSINPHGPSPTT